MSDLRREVEELRRQIEALASAQRPEDYLARWIADQGEPFVAVREAIVEALLATGSYSLKLADEAYSLMWADRSAEPIVVHYVRDWRAAHGEQLSPQRRLGMLNTPDAQPDPSESAVARAQGHAEQPAEPVEPDQDAIADEIAQLRRRIAVIDAQLAEQLPTVQQHAEQEQSPAFERRSTWPTWRDKTF